VKGIEWHKHFVKIVGMKNGVSSLLVLQGVYYLVTGLWPLVHIASFVYVTGPKTDIWLVKMLSLLIACAGLALMKGSSERNNSFAINVLGITSAVSFIFIDLFCTLNGTISKVYLVDAFLQLFILVTWCILVFRKNPRYNVFSNFSV
jgi:hypothetical protein